MNQEDRIMEKLESFEERVIRMMHKIEERLSVIEANFEQAAQLASGLMDQNPIFSRDNIEQIKNTFSNLGEPKRNMAGDVQSISEMMESLKGFKDRLSGIQDVLKTQVLPPKS